MLNHKVINAFDIILHYIILIGEYSVQITNQLTLKYYHIR